MILPFEDGTDSTVQMNTRRPNGNGYIINHADVFNNTPLRAFLQSWLATWVRNLMLSYQI